MAGSRMAAKKHNLKKKPGQKMYAAAKRARLLYQGVAATARKNFGTKSAAPNKTGFLRNKITQLITALDAKIPRTLGLPRAVGPYTVIRTNTVVSPGAGENFLLFSPLLFNSGVSDSTWRDAQWLSAVGLAQKGAGGDAVGNPNGIRTLTNPIGVLGEATDLVPASLTVQVVNSKPLEQASGTYFMGRVNQMFDYGGSTTTTWDDLRYRFISYFSPRMLAGGKLALRGVQCSAYPLDMTEYSSFREANSAVLTTWNDRLSTASLSPIIFVSNQDMVADSVQFLVTIEWRVRFDPLNPAVASHQHHDTLADEAWNGLVKVASGMGHGVEEIAEGVAAGGAIVGGAAMMPGIVGMALA